ncbi:hypothetical protein BRADI_3g43143v3 [Brachypodium distachyon]|uniref:Uncharacterized protein n=1 Tax=Brachypodium distachyon TaxID=15368 RepID=A0A2K2D2S5_BRADI|nr:hypothetical protein BRADI_3g43143v3 [Brachypodium distachyon]
MRRQRGVEIRGTTGWQMDKPTTWRNIPLFPCLTAPGLVDLLGGHIDTVSGFLTGSSLFDLFFIWSGGVDRDQDGAMGPLQHPQQLGYRHSLNSQLEEGYLLGWPSTCPCSLCTSCISNASNKEKSQHKEFIEEWFRCFDYLVI